MDDNIVDVNYTHIPNEQSNKNYYTINQISKELQVSETDILFWINKLNDILQINSTGMFQLFTKTDFENIKKIKQLILIENKTIEEVKEYFNQDNNLIVIKQKSQSELEIVTIFNSLFQLQNKELAEIKDSNKQILEYNQKITKILIQFITQYTTNNINQEIISNKIDELIKNQAKLKKEITLTVEGIMDEKLNESHKKYECKVNELEKRQTEKFAKLSSDYRKILDEKAEREKEEKNNHGFWNIKNWFKK